MRALGRHILLAPTINQVTHPRWGRAQETYGEDSYLLGEMGASFITGAQYDPSVADSADPDQAIENTYRIQACVKHLAANNIEDTRIYVNAVLDDRTLREVCLPHFKKAVETKVACVVTSYNRVNGSYNGYSQALVRDILAAPEADSAPQAPSERVSPPVAAPETNTAPPAAAPVTTVSPQLTPPAAALSVPQQPPAQQTGPSGALAPKDPSPFGAHGDAAELFPKLTIPIQFDGYFWVDTGYMKRTNAQSGQYDQAAAYMQGRYVLGATYYAEKGEFFGLARGQFIGLVNEFSKSQYEPHTLDAYVQAGLKRKFDIQVGRFLAWEVYHRSGRVIFEAL
jgi:hypothetical protein